jgi:hypothetical protein
LGIVPKELKAGSSKEICRCTFISPYLQ